MNNKKIFLKKIVSVILTMGLVLSFAVGCDRPEELDEMESTKVYNDNKGTKKLSEAVDTFMKAVENQDGNMLMSIYDDKMNYKKNPRAYITGFHENLKQILGEKDYAIVNWSAVEIEIGEEYESNGMVCSEVIIILHPKGWIFENSSLKDAARFELHFHKADTPQGSRWFYGGKE